MDITDFLLARINEEEENAGRYVEVFPDGDMAPLFRRILAECAAKRAIIEHCRTLEAKVFNDDLWNVDEHDDILEALAAVYADHPDYKQEWAV